MGGIRKLSQAARALRCPHRARHLGWSPRRGGDDLHLGGSQSADPDELQRPRPRSQRARHRRRRVRRPVHAAVAALLDRAPRPHVLITVHKEHSMLRSLRLAVLLGAGAVLAAPAQEIASDTLLTVDHYLDWEQVADPQISPDGAQIVYTRRWVNKVDDKWDSALWIMSVDGSHHRFLVKGSDARWSPDGRRILYLADGEPKGTQIFVRWMDAEGASSQITRVAEKPSDAKWSPDGKAISFVMVVPDSTAWSISLPKAPEGAKWTAAPRVVDDLHYRQDRVGFMRQGYMHLFSVPADGGTARALTSGWWNVGARFDGLVFGAGYDWTPDGRTIVFDGLQDTSWDRQYQVSRIYALDVASGAIRSLVARPGFWESPTLSPDGRTIAFTGSDSSEQTHRTADLWTVGIDGSGMRDLSRRLDRDPDNLRWAPDGKGVYFTAPDRGAINIRYADLSGGVRDVTQGAQVVSPASLARTLGLRRGVLQRHRPQLARPRLRRPDGGRGRRGRARVRGHDAHVRRGMLGRRCPVELGDRAHQPLRRRGRALPGDRLDRHGGADRYPLVHVQLLPPAVLGQARRVAGALVSDVRGAGHDADAPDDRGARPAHADAADRGVLRGAQDPPRTHDAAALQRGVPRDGIETVELHADPALHDELVSEVPPRRQRGGHRGGEPLARRSTQPAQPAFFPRVLVARVLHPRAEDGGTLHVAHHAARIVGTRHGEHLHLVLEQLPHRRLE